MRQQQVLEHQQADDQDFDQDQLQSIVQQIEYQKVKILIFDCDLIIDLFPILSKAWSDVCRLYSFHILSISLQKQIFLKNTPHDIAKYFLEKNRKHSTPSTGGSTPPHSITIQEILLAYKKFYERIVFTSTIQPKRIILSILQYFHSTHQFCLYSQFYPRDHLVFYLSTTGIIHYFHSIISYQDISLKLQSNTSILKNYKIYYHILSRLKVESSICLFFENIPHEEQYHLLNFHFFDLKFFPQSYSDSVISHSRGTSMGDTDEGKWTIGWKWIGIWIGIPSLFCCLWYFVFLMFKACIPYLLESEFLI